MLIAWAIMVIAAIIMMIKWPASTLGYIYCVLVGLALAAAFLYPYTSSPYEIMHCMTLGGGIGAVFGLGFAVSIHEQVGALGLVAWIILVPILMLVVCFFVVLILGFGLLLQNNGEQAITAGLVMWGLIAAIIGGGGSIIVIIIEK